VCLEGRISINRNIWKTMGAGKSGKQTKHHGVEPAGVERPESVSRRVNKDKAKAKKSRNRLGLEMRGSGEMNTPATMRSKFPRPGAGLEKNLDGPRERKAAPKYQDA